MSTPITLTVGNITLTHSSGHPGIDHGMLFQEADRKQLRHESINYEFYERNPSLTDLSNAEICFCRSLRSMIPRLEMLGYTLLAVKVDYDRNVQDEEARAAFDSSIDDRMIMGFEKFVNFIRQYPISELSNAYDENYDENNEYGLFGMNPDTTQLPMGDVDRNRGGYSERSHFGNMIGFLHPYSALRVLAENPANLNLDVVWDYGLIVEAGWAFADEFVPEARRTQTYLIATEGTSDTHILKRAIGLLCPEIQDFFKFIELEDRHPFSGTGNLAKFAEGLVKIDVHNRVLFIFDNDAEGCEAFQNLQRFKFSVNMRAMVLPHLEELSSFSARGPEGITNADINGRAAAIECYLDLRLKDRNPPRVTWTNYKEKLGEYQGSLEFKESYALAFYNVTAESIESNEYDVSKLRIVLESIQTQCTLMAEKMLPIMKISDDVIL